jgi:hypothetical protein
MHSGRLIVSTKYVGQLKGRLGELENLNSAFMSSCQWAQPTSVDAKILHLTSHFELDSNLNNVVNNVNGPEEKCRVIRHSDER